MLPTRASTIHITYLAGAGAGTGIDGGRVSGAAMAPSAAAAGGANTNASAASQELKSSSGSSGNSGGSSTSSRLLSSLPRLSGIAETGGVSRAPLPQASSFPFVAEGFEEGAQNNNLVLSGSGGGTDVHGGSAALAAAEALRADAERPSVSDSSYHNLLKLRRKLENKLRMRPSLADLLGASVLDGMHPHASMHSHACAA